MPLDTLLCCPPLPAFDPADWQQIAAAFATAPSLPLLQPWRPAPQSRLRPGVVRLGWREQALWVLAELDDEDIFNPATELNQHAYKMGDVFEMFLHPPSQTEYYELHISPDNQKLQLRCRPVGEAPDEALEKPAFRLEEIGGELFRSWVHVAPEEQRWRVLAAVPAAAICRSGRIAPGDEWLVSFGRYDYTRGEAKPVISSTSAHAQPNFHRRHEWRRIRF